MKRILMAATILAAATSYAHADRWIVKEFGIGCITKAMSERASDLLLSGDTAATQRFLMLRIIDGECKSFDVGDTVYREHITSMTDHCLRKAGDTVCYWPIRNIWIRPAVLEE